MELRRGVASFVKLEKARYVRGGTGPNAVDIKGYNRQSVAGLRAVISKILEIGEKSSRVNDGLTFRTLKGIKV